MYTALARDIAGSGEAAAAGRAAKAGALSGAARENAGIFAGLDERALAEVSASASRHRFAAGAALFAQGDPASTFSVLLAGELKMVQATPEGQQVIVRYIAPGEMFGAVALFCAIPYPATALAVVDSLAAAWDRATAERLMRHYPEIGANALRITGQRLQELQNRYRELATERVEQRVAHALLRLSTRADQRIEFPITRQDIAEMTGTTLHSVSRILSQWESLGLVGGGRCRITLRRPEALAEIADGL